MKRYGLIVLLVLVLAWAAVAIARHSPSLGLLSAGALLGPARLSPACLPATTRHAATLPVAGTDTTLEVSPEPETDTANPDTQISFLGIAPADIREVTVVGHRSGAHPGRLHAYSQGDGASFLLNAPFDAGEQVLVHAVIASGASSRQIAFHFRTDDPYPTEGAAEFPNPPAAPADYQSFATMPGAQAPILHVTTDDRDPAAGDILTTNGPGPGQYGPLIYTPQGRLVWFEHLPPGETAEDLSEQTFEGQRDLTWWRGRVLAMGFGQGEDLVMDSRYQTVARVKGGNGLHADLHEFQLAPDGVAYITAYNPIRCNLAPAGGPAGGTIVDTAIQEIDIKTGLVRWEWHSLDHVAVSESETSPPKSNPWDWFHLNSIDPEPDGDILISARNTWAAYQLEGRTGRIQWRLGGSNSSFKMGPGTGTAWQHDGRLLPGGEITLFDDGSNPPEHPQSRGVRIVLDPSTHEARLRVAFTHPDQPLLAASQGNMQTLADGNTLVGFGGVPQMTEYAQTGAVLFDAHLPYEMIFYRSFRFPWSGRPSRPPAVLANLNNTGEETIVHMSWNGATEVSAWRVLAGKQSGALSPQATLPADEFETAAILPKKFSYAAVQALGPSGRVLATSHPVATRSYHDALEAGR
jgi:Arylsulfotransferase (ASST)